MTWEERAREAAKKRPLKGLKVLPQMPGMTAETARFLKFKSLRYILFHEEGKGIVRHFLRHPLRFGWRYVRALVRGKTYVRDGDFFFYGIRSEGEFVKASEGAHVVVGFSYCQKPFECPSGRFTDECRFDLEDPVCQQCPIGKVREEMPRGAEVLLIPTVHYIGDHMFRLRNENPKKRILFLITACEMTLEMFGDWGHMVGIEGIGVRLDGRICNTMRAFELSERGVKPGLTVVTEETERRVLDLLDACGGKACCHERR